METGVKVFDVMTTKPVTVEPDTSVTECAKLMREKNIASLIVKDESRFVGIVTEQDIVRRAVASEQSLENMTVKDIMSSGVVVASPDMDLFEAVTVMRDYGVRHLPVVAEGTILGVVSIKDILKIEPDLFDILLEKWELIEDLRRLRLSADSSEEDE